MLVCVWTDVKWPQHKPKQFRVVDKLLVSKKLPDNEEFRPEGNSGIGRLCRVFDKWLMFHDMCVVIHPSLNLLWSDRKHDGPLDAQTSQCYFCTTILCSEFAIWCCHCTHLQEWYSQKRWQTGNTSSQELWRNERERIWKIRKECNPRDSRWQKTFFAVTLHLCFSLRKDERALMEGVNQWLMCLTRGR